MWNSAEILGACAAALRLHADQIELEQSVRGLDAMSEVQLHPILATGLSRQLSCAVLRETVYPAPDALATGRRPRRSERERCDLVLLPPGATRLRDAVLEAARVEAASDTLFAGAEARAIQVDPDPLPEDAFWLEVKSVGQFVVVDGAARPNRAYGSELRRAVRSDVEKLAAAPGVRAGAMLLVLFAEDLRVASHDWSVAAREVAGIAGVGWERTGALEVNDRIGNRVCFLGLLPVQKP